MTTDTPVKGSDAAPPMTPERWRQVDAILQGALACEPSQRDAFVADACGEDDVLRREVAELLAAHDHIDDAFLERPAAEALGADVALSPLADRLTKAVAGSYAIERELAQGGMATVYLAHDRRHDRRVAIKVLRAELAAAVGAERFLEEIRLTASLQHPHILPLFDSGSEGELLWYVMPFVEGETLRARLAREGRLPVDVALQIVWEMADALDYAHRQGVVHRDVKPENVLLQGGHALVADFGVALALEHAGGERLTRTGLTIGTPQYMAPEQAAGNREIDARTDVHALGAVLHEMLAGESPFAAASRLDVLRRVIHEPVTAFATRRADVPPRVDATIQRALAKEPDDRFPSAAAFAAALVAPVGGAEQAPPALGGAQAGSSRGRTVSARAAVYAAVVTLVLGLVGGWALARSSLVQRWTSAAGGGWSPPGGAVDQTPAATLGDMTLTIVDRTGRTRRSIPAHTPWTPRFSPDGRRVAYGAFGEGRNTSDLWVMDVGAGTIQRLTDDDGDSNDPQWSRDGSKIAYSVSAPGGKDLWVRDVDGGGGHVLARRDATQYPSDWLPDGSALLVTEDSRRNRRDILVQPADGAPARPYVSTAADESAARVSPDGRWVAYTSDESGRQEVYLDSYPRPTRRVMISLGGGVHPVWRGDGRELYYWRDGALLAVQLGAASGDAPPTIGMQTVLFREPYHIGPNTMYDASPDGELFAIVQRP